MTDHNLNINKLLNDVPKTSWMRKHLTCGRCLLLDWATSDVREKPDFPAKLTGLLHVRENHQGSMLTRIEIPDGRQVTLADCYPQFAARLRLINAFVQDDTDLEDAIFDVANTTEQAWGHRTLDEIRQFDKELLPDTNDPGKKCREPSFMSQIDSAGCQELLRRIANQPAGKELRFGWSHPGIQMAGELLAALSGDDRKPQLTVRTKVMFAFPHLTHPRGILAEITVERIPDGCGLLIPDAFRCGYLNMDAEGTFSTGLQNALWAARNYAAMHLSGDGVHDFDWRWSIDLSQVFAMQQRELRDLIQMSIGGASGEAAFACALIAAHKDNPDNAGEIDPLDPHMGVTASIKSRKWGTDKLKGVGSIDLKTVLGQMERRRLLEVIIAKDQDKTLIPRKDEDPRFEYPEAASVKEAYELMTRHPRLTR